MTKAFRKPPEWFKSFSIRDLKSNEILGTLFNLSKQKLVLESPGACQSGSQYECRLAMPSAVLGHTEITFKMTCGESLLNPSGGYLNSFSSLEADPDDADVLEMLIIIFAVRAFES